MTEELINATETAPLRDPLELMNIFDSADDLPTLPEVAITLQKAVNNPDSSAKDIAKIIEQDPSISTKVLKMVNSVFYAPAHGSEITQLSPAIARLGFITVANIALSTSVFQAFSANSNPVFDRREFWKHSVCTGIITSVLYDFCMDRIEQPISRDIAHLSGIVHDMGKVLFEKYANEEFHIAISSAKEADLPSVKEEERYIGMGHDHAGAFLAGKWRLGREIKAVVQWHHDPLACPEEDLRPLAMLVHMADYICNNQHLGNSGNPCPMYDQRVREHLGLTPDKIGELMGYVEQEAAKSDVLLSLTD